MKINGVILSLAGLGLLSLALSLFISTQTERIKPGLKPLARLEHNMGKVSILRKNMTVKEELHRKALLFALDSVETSSDGDATLDFDSSYRIRIPENSLVTINDENAKTILIIKRGDVQVENYGREGSVYITRDGIRWSATDYEMTYKKQVAEGTLPELAPSIPGFQNESGKMEGLSSDSIQDTMKAHRGNFFRCYTQLLQRTPGVAGEASISFTIERTGKVSSSDVTSSSINDMTFKKCLLEATRRIEFKSFSGDPISTVFPLRFE